MGFHVPRSWSQYSTGYIRENIRLGKAVEAIDLKCFTLFWILKAVRPYQVIEHRAPDQMFNSSEVEVRSVRSSRRSINVLKK